MEMQLETEPWCCCNLFFRGGGGGVLLFLEAVKFFLVLCTSWGGKGHFAVCEAKKWANSPELARGWGWGRWCWDAFYLYKCQRATACSSSRRDNNEKCTVCTTRRGGSSSREARRWQRVSQREPTAFFFFFISTPKLTSVQRWNDPWPSGGEEQRCIWIFTLTFSHPRVPTLPGLSGRTALAAGSQMLLKRFYGYVVPLTLEICRSRTTREFSKRSFEPLSWSPGVSLQPNCVLIPFSSVEVFISARRKRRVHDDAAVTLRVCGCEWFLLIRHL